MSITIGKSARLWAELGYGFRKSSKSTSSGLTIENLFDRVGHLQRMRRLEWYKSVVSGDAILKLCQSRQGNANVRGIRVGPKEDTESQHDYVSY